MYRINGKDYIIKGSSEDNGLYENFYYVDKLITIYNIEINGQRGTLTKTSVIYRELGTDIILTPELYPIQWEIQLEKQKNKLQSGICYDKDDENYLNELIIKYKIDTSTGLEDPSTKINPHNGNTGNDENEFNEYKNINPDDNGKGIFDDTLGSKDNEYNRGLLPSGADINNPDTVKPDDYDHAEGQPQESSIKNKGTTYPIIRINDHYFVDDEIQYFSMETGYYKNYYDYEHYKMPVNGFLPTFKLIAVSANANLLKTDFVKQGDRCAVFFSSSHSMVKSIRCDFRVTNVVTNNMNQNKKEHYIRYIINGELYVPDLRNENIRYNFNGSSRDAMMDAAKRLRLSYFFCDPEDTDDVMVWCNCKTPELFIKDLTTHAWKNPNSFFESWIDPRYGLSFQNINKLLGEEGFDEQIDITFWINTFLNNRAMDNQAEKKEDEKAQTDKPQAKIFTNIPSDDEANTVYHVNKWRMVNNAQEIQDFVGLNCKQQFDAVNPGLQNNTKYSVDFSLCINRTKFDPDKNPKEDSRDKQKISPNPFYVLLGPARNTTYANADETMKTSETESSNKNEPEKVTNPQSDGDANTIIATDGNMLTSGNTHKFYEVAYEHNMRNLLQLQKQVILVELNGANLTILRGEKIPMILMDINRAMSVITNKLPEDYDGSDPKQGQDILNTYIYEAESGWFIIDGIEWVYDPGVEEQTGTYWRTNVKLTRREWPVPGYKETIADEFILVEADGKVIKKAIADLAKDDIIIGKPGQTPLTLDDLVVIGKAKNEPLSLNRSELNTGVTQEQLDALDKSVAVVNNNGDTTMFESNEDIYLYTANGVEVIHGTSDTNFLLDLVDQYVQNKDKVKNSTIPLTGLKDFMKELYHLISDATDNKVKLVSARRWAVNEYGNKVDGNAYIMKNGYYKCMNAIGDVLYFKSNNSRHLYGEAIDIINVGMDFTELMTNVIMKNKDILLLMYNNGISAYIEQSKDDIGTTTKHYHLGTDTIKQKEFWASVKAVLGSDKIPGTLITFSNYMKNNKQTPEIIKVPVNENDIIK